MFAIARLAVMKTASEHLSGLNYLEQKTLATWVVENQLVQQRLEGKWPETAGWKGRGAGRADLVLALSRCRHGGQQLQGAGHGGAHRAQGREPGGHDPDLSQPMNIHQRVSMIRSWCQPMSQSNTRPSCHSGFTLLEMLVAIAIFATLSLGPIRCCKGADQRRGGQAQGGPPLRIPVTRLQPAGAGRHQMVPRSGRIDGENNKVLLAASRFGQQSDDWGMAFTSRGWLNPDGMLPRSGLQRVGWRLKGQTLERLSYLYPDPAIGTEPRIQPVLTGVTALRLYFYDRGQWKEEWTQRPAALRAGGGAGAGGLRHHTSPVPDRGRWPEGREWRLDQ